MALALSFLLLWEKYWIDTVGFSAQMKEQETQINENFTDFSEQSVELF